MGIVPGARATAAAQCHPIDLGMNATLARLLFEADDRFREFAETEASVRAPWPGLLNRPTTLGSSAAIRHAQDEVRHARCWTSRRPSLRRAAWVHPCSPRSSRQKVDLRQMGEIDFLAFVHEAEKRATAEFALHRDALGDKGAFFEDILADEKRHVAWTGHALDRHRAAGRADEVDAALKRVRRQRWLGLWLAFARRLSLVTSALLLTLLYAVVVGPFTLLAGRWQEGWRPAAAPGPLDRQF